ncbi:trypco2 family protein [Actinoplanes sp. L3-i22]|uniref:trypco2 family protein n=1 Tax=Actinoplanes sp. L3-i22 TaxID=2836373 RepID=UPI001C85FE3E|nr:trypco2 family protein [Actinoplanes sp. L3-i22]
MADSPGLGLVEMLSALRSDLVAAMEAPDESGLRFPVDGVEVEVKVAVKKGVDGKAGVNFWVVQLGTTGKLSKEEVHTVTVKLGAPVDEKGDPIKVRQGFSQEP